MPVTLLKQMSTAFTFILLVFFPASEGCSFKGSPPTRRDPGGSTLLQPLLLRVSCRCCTLYPDPTGRHRSLGAVARHSTKKGKEKEYFVPRPLEYLQSLPG